MYDEFNKKFNSRSLIKTSKALLPRGYGFNGQFLFWPAVRKNGGGWGNRHGREVDDGADAVADS